MLTITTQQYRNEAWTALIRLGRGGEAQTFGDTEAEAIGLLVLMHPEAFVQPKFHRNVG